MNILSFINYLGQRLSNQLSTPSNEMITYKASQKEILLESFKDKPLSPTTINE
jgi:hypothetical protein